MLDPNEPLDQQVARLRESAGLPPDAPDRLTDEDVTRAIPVTVEAPGGGRERPPVDAGPRDVWWDSPSRAARPSWAGGASWGGASEGGGPRHSAGRGSRSRLGETTARREHVGRRRAPSRASQVTAKIATELRNLRREVLATRNRPRVIVAAGLVTILLALVVAAWSGAFGGEATPEGPTGPAFETQEYRDRGIALNVPAGWERADADSSADYRDPSERWIRITVEPTDTTAMALLQGAQVRLQDPAVCPAPFVPLRLVEASLAGLVGAELEYLCGEGDAQRHGIWRAVVREDTAYHLFLSTKEGDFATSRVIYDEMVRSFQFL